MKSRKRRHFGGKNISERPPPILVVEVEKKSKSFEINLPMTELIELTKLSNSRIKFDSVKNVSIVTKPTNLKTEIEIRILGRHCSIRK